jgi:hypothetical protein
MAALVAAIHAVGPSLYCRRAGSAKLLSERKETQRSPHPSPAWGGWAWMAATSAAMTCGKIVV